LLNRFGGDEDAAEVKGDTEKWIAIAAEQLCNELEPLRTALTSKKLGGLGVSKPYKITEACDARDALAKTLYGKMFDWLIQKINWSLSQVRCHGVVVSVSVFRLLSSLVPIYSYPLTRPSLLSLSCSDIMGVSRSLSVLYTILSSHLIYSYPISRIHPHTGPGIGGRCW
jgi:hypothetical protein